MKKSQPHRVGIKSTVRQARDLVKAIQPATQVSQALENRNTESLVGLMGIVHKIKNRGLFNLLGAAFNRIVPASLFRFTMMDVYELDLESVKTVAAAEDVVVENVGQNSSKRLALQVATWNSVDSKELDKHLGYSARVVEPEVSIQNAPIVGGVWVAKDYYPETAFGFTFIFKPRYAWVYAAYVDPQIRGKNIYQRTLSYACTDLSEQGYKEIQVAFAPWNKASAYVHKKHSKRRLGRIASIHFLGTAAIFTTGEIRKSKTLAFRSRQTPVEVIL